MTPTEKILNHFEKISAIPRGTKNEAALRQWLIDWASSLGFVSKTDPTGSCGASSSSYFLYHSPMIFINTRLRLRPSNSP